MYKFPSVDHRFNPLLPFICLKNEPNLLCEAECYSCKYWNGNSWPWSQKYLSAPFCVYRTCQDDLFFHGKVRNSLKLLFMVSYWNIFFFLILRGKVFSRKTDDWSVSCDIQHNDFLEPLAKVTSSYLKDQLHDTIWPFLIINNYFITMRWVFLSNWSKQMECLEQKLHECINKHAAQCVKQENPMTGGNSYKCGTNLIYLSIIRHHCPA